MDTTTNCIGLVHGDVDDVKGPQDPNTSQTTSIATVTSSVVRTIANRISSITNQTNRDASEDVHSMLVSLSVEILEVAADDEEAKV